MKDLFWLCNLSQSQLTEACGLTANYSEIGIERKFFSADTMKKIVKVLNI